MLAYLLLNVLCYIAREQSTHMHAFLIIGSTKQERTTKLASLIADNHISTFDVRPLILADEQTSLGIALLKNWQKQLFLMPQHSPLAAGVIQSADLLTTEAQNALLKTLEEPPLHTHIYMEAQSDVSFLPTILSRCQILKLQDTTKTMTKKEQACLDTIQMLLAPDVKIGQILATLDTLNKNKNDASLWIDDAIVTIHKAKEIWSIASYAELAKQLMLAKKYLASNVSYKLVLDEIFLSFMTRQS